MKMGMVRCDHCKTETSMKRLNPGEHTQGTELFWLRGWYHVTKRHSPKEWDFCSLRCLIAKMDEEAGD